MKKRFPLFLLILFLCTLQIGCAEETISKEEIVMDSDDDESSEEDDSDNMPKENNEGSDTSRIELVASRDILINNGVG